VLEGIETEDWPKINQLVIEVHDIEGRLSRISALLDNHGYQQIIKQDDLLEATNLYTIYACRLSEDGDEVFPSTVMRTTPVYWGKNKLTAELRQHLAVRLPEYMAPAAYVCLEKLPLTANGKLDRRALPAPEGDAYGVRDYEEPIGEIETLLAGIWSEVLKVERVGRHDNFFELGGHSLLIVRIIARMRKVGLEADVRAIFITSTLAELAAGIDRSDSVAKASSKSTLEELGIRWDNLNTIEVRL
jgi:Phosphopantetheine attachment site